MKSKHKSKKSITRVVTLRLFSVVLITCLVTFALTYMVMANKIEAQSMDLLLHNVEDTSNDIKELADNQYIEFLSNVAMSTTGSDGDISTTADVQRTEELDAFLQKNVGSYFEVNIVNDKGVIVASSEPGKRNTSILDYEESAEFAVLSDGKTPGFVQNHTVTREDGKVFRYAGFPYTNGTGFLHMGTLESTYRDATANITAFAATNRRIGDTGYLLIGNARFQIISSPESSRNGNILVYSGIEIDRDDCDYKTMRCEVYGEPAYVCVNKVMMSYYVAGIYPEAEARANLNSLMLITLLIEGVVYIVLFILLVILLKRTIGQRLAAVNSSLAKITEGDMNERVNVTGIVEFETLSDDINMTVDKLKQYIDEEKTRIDDELTLARNIQQSVLPRLFPPYPDRHEFELYASMSTAKEVGGDLYDFYLIEKNTLAVMIGDVSGKGIPAAMFMMAAKLLVKSLAKNKIPVNEVLTIANNKLCDENDAEMFITAWLGFLDLKTGEMRFANAGHNPPILIHDGKADYLEQEADFVLAGFDDMTYTEQRLQMHSGDMLYLYTDGVTEAKNRDGNLFTPERLQSLLSENISEGTDCEDVCKMVSNDIESFVDGFERSDDITMLCLKYYNANSQDR